jgi:hypothetical protein
MLKGVFLFVLSVSMAGVTCAAPMTPLHSKMLLVQQTIFADGQVQQVAKLTTPSSASTKSTGANSDIMTNALGAISIPAADLAAITFVDRIDFASVFAKLDEMRDYEQALSSSYYGSQGAYASDPSTGCYSTGTDCFRPPSNITQQTNSAFSANPAYWAAIDIRQHVNNAVGGSPEVIRYLMDLMMKTSPSAQAFKQSVLDYLKRNKVESAWTDIEHEVVVAGVKQMVSATVQINATDVIGVTTGQYTGAGMVALPGAVGTDNLANVIDVVYTTGSQYPDLLSTNPSAAIFGDQAKYGVLSWKTTDKGAPMVAGGVGNQYTHNAYDAPYPQEDIQAGRVNTLNNATPFRKPQGYDYPAGVQCLAIPKSVPNSEGLGCVAGYNNLPTLMEQNHARSGTLTYVGRWEIAHTSKPGTSGGPEVAFPPAADIQEQQRMVSYNICRDMQFFNKLAVQYQVHRMVQVFDIIYSGGVVTLIPHVPTAADARQPIFWDEQFAPAPYTLPNRVQYTANGSLSYPRAVSPLPSIEMEDYLQSDAMIDPLTWTSSPTGLAPYNNTLDPSIELAETWYPRTTQRLTTSIGSNSSLPPGVGNPSVRDYVFTCQDYNAAQIATTFNNLPSEYVPGSFGVNDPRSDGQTCVASWQVYVYTTVYTPVVTTSTDPITNVVTSTTTMVPSTQTTTEQQAATMNNTTCEETCPRNGNTSTWKICPRPNELP